MAKNYVKVNARVVDTVRPAIAGADRHRGWNAVRSFAGRMTTPLLPDDYLHLANPLWSARELRGRILEVRRETADSATLVIKPGWGFTFDYEPGQYIGIGVLMDGRWKWRSYSSLTSEAPVGSGRPYRHDHRQGDAGRLSVNPPGRRGGARHDRPVGRTAGQFRHARPRAVLGAFAHGGFGDHTGDVDAADAGAPGSDHRHRAPALRADPCRCHVRARNWPTWLWRTRVTGCRSGLRARKGGLDLVRLGDEVPDWRDRQTWACGPEAMLNDGRAGVGRRGCQLPAAPRAVCRHARRTARQRRYGDLRAQRKDGGRRRGDFADGSR